MKKQTKFVSAKSEVTTTTPESWFRRLMAVTIQGWTIREYIAVMGWAVMFVMVGASLLLFSLERAPKTVSRPLSQPIPVVVEVEAAAPQTGRSWTGIASYYSRSGCLGCSKTLTMANGQPLDDNAFTVAFNKLPLGSKVKVINQKNMWAAYVTVTDRGGFERLGRIIDITPAVKEHIGCSDLCPVIVEEVL